MSASDKVALIMVWPLLIFVLVVYLAYIHLPVEIEARPNASDNQNAVIEIVYPPVSQPQAKPIEIWYHGPGGEQQVYKASGKR